MSHLKDRIYFAILMTMLLDGIAEAQSPLLTGAANCQCNCGPVRVQLPGLSREACRSSVGIKCGTSELADCDLVLETLAPAGTASPFLCTTGETWAGCIAKTVAQPQVLSVETKKAINLAAAAAVKESASNLLTAAPSVSDATAKKSFLPQMQFAAGLADFLDENGTLLFSYNTPEWGWGRLSLEARPSRPDVFDKLLAAIPEDQREAQEESANKKLDGFDRVDYSVKLSILGFTGARNGSDDPSSFAQTLIFGEDGNYRDKRLSALDALANQKFVGLLPLHASGNLVPIPTAQERLDGEKLIREAVAARDAANQGYLRYLDQVGFSRLGQLLDQQPQFYFNGEFRHQDELAGPKGSYKIGLAWEIGFGPNYNKFVKFLQSCDGNTLNVATPVSCFQEYFEKPEVKNNRKWRMALKADYENTDAYDSPLAGVTLHLEEAQSWVASFTLGGVLKFQEEAPLSAEAVAGPGVAGPPKKAVRIEQSRLDFKAQYDDVSGDAQRQDRLNLTLTFSQRLNDDFSFELSAVWASQPEYLGTVDRELGALAGLRYKINRNS